MIINIIEPKEVTDNEVLEFFIHQVALGLPFEQFIGYFEVVDLDRVRKLWEEADDKFAELIGEYEFGYVDEDELEWREYI